MSEYTIRPGGPLKLKGGVAEGGIVKRRKKKSNAKVIISTKDLDDDNVKEPLFQGDNVPSGSARNSPPASSGAYRKTNAQKRFDEARNRTREKRILELAKQTHKDRVNDFNAHLESLSEHHDIPKVGPG